MFHLPFKLRQPHLFAGVMSPDATTAGAAAANGADGADAADAADAAAANAAAADIRATPSVILNHLIRDHFL